jgi:hypothetical protein
MSMAVLRRRIRSSATSSASVAVSVTLARTVLGAGAVLHTGGVALPVGALRVGDPVSLFDGVAPLPLASQLSLARHEDGSVALLRVQCTTAVSGALTLRTRDASSAAVAWQSVPWPTATVAADWRTLRPCAGVVYNTDATLRCASYAGLPLQPQSADGAVGAAYNATLAETVEAAVAGWDGIALNASGGQYDRPTLLLCLFLRTGIVAHLRDALAMIARHRDAYWLGATFAFPESLAWNALWPVLSLWYGDVAFESAALGNNQVLQTWLPGGSLRAPLAAGTLAPRVIAHSGIGYMVALVRSGLGDSVVPTSSLTVKQLLTAVIADVLAAPNWRASNGMFFLSTAAPADYSFHFQTALLCRWLCECVALGIGDAAAIRARVTSVAAWMWTNARPTPADAFVDGDRAVAGSTSGLRAPDLDQFWAPVFGSLAFWGVDAATWRARGDSILAIASRLPRTGGQLEGPFLSGQKQFNESFFSSQHYFALRGI